MAGGGVAFGRLDEVPQRGLELVQSLVGKTSRDFDASETITQFFLGL